MFKLLAISFLAFVSVSISSQCFAKPVDQPYIGKGRDNKDGGSSSKLGSKSHGGPIKCDVRAASKQSKLK